MSAPDLKALTLQLDFSNYYGVDLVSLALDGISDDEPLAIRFHVPVEQWNTFIFQTALLRKVGKLLEQAVMNGGQIVQEEE